MGTPVNRIDAKFAELRAEGKRAFIPYIMAGHPSLARTAELVHELEACGADIIELGVPFSDPVADGPVIQRAAEAAVAGGVTLRKVIAMVRELRQTTQVPIILMTYYNPVFKYGEEAFARDAVKAGVDGVIIPDLPPHEAGPLIGHARAHGLCTIFLFAPTSTAGRKKLVAKASSGFIYYVSITGITGSALKLDAGAMKSIAGMRKMSGLPVALGFGVSTAEEARAVGGLADGVIVGSAIVRRTGEQGFGDYVRELSGAVHAAR